MEQQRSTVSGFFETFFGEGGRPAQPDERPLYAYRCTASELDVLRPVVSSAARHLGLGRVNRQAAGAFVLYAAEWWRRSYSGGAWSWNGVFESLGAPRPVYAEIQRATEQGLLWWRRPRVVLGGRQMLLGTLAAEGGLPLALVESHGTWIRRYLRSLLEDLKVYRMTGQEPLELLVERAAASAPLLPASLRRGPVYRLSSLLVGRVWALRGRVGELNPERPLALLDERAPGWRDELPLRLDDGPAIALLQGLVQDADRLARGGSSRVRGLVGLRRTGEGLWTLERSITIPGQLKDEDLRDHFGLDPSSLPRRVRIEARNRSTGARQDIASLVRLAGGAGRWAMSRLSTAPETGAPAADGVEVVLVSAATTPAPSVDLQGLSELTDLPWVFVQGDDELWTLVAQGRCRRREPALLVAIPAGWALEPHPGAQSTPVGSIDALGRQLVELAGSARLVGPEGSFGVMAEAPRDEVCTLKPVGQRIQIGVESNGPFRGPPEFLAMNGTEHARALRPGDPLLSFTVAGRPTRTPLGLVRARYVVDGEVRAEVKLAIAPEDLTLDLTLATRQRPGALRVASRSLDAVGVDGAPGCDVVPDEGSRGVPTFRVTFPPLVAPPAVVTLHLRLMNGGEVVLPFRYPQSLGRFEFSSGEALATETVVDLSTLGSIRAVARAANESEKWLLDARALGSSGNALQRHRLLPGEGRTTRELELRDVRDEVESLLAALGDLDAEVDLRLLRLGVSTPPSRLRVRRYTRALVPHRPEEAVSVDQPVSNQWAVARHLLSPSETEERLPLLAGDLESPRWAFEVTERAPGPWLITLESDDGCDTRPLLWTVPGDVPEADGLSTAIQQPDPANRSRALRDELQRMAADPEGARWSLVMETLDLLSFLPASTFDLCRALVLEPDALTLAVLMAQNTQEVLGSLSELPHLWEAVPVHSWRSALRQMDASLMKVFDHRLRALNTLGALVATVGRDVPAILLAGAELRWIRDMELPKELSSEAEQLRSGVPAAVAEITRRAEWGQVRARHANDEWPTPADVRRGFDGLLSNASAASRTALEDVWSSCHSEPSHVVSVRNAPSVAAAAAALGLPLPPEVQFALRACRDFDPEWFRLAYCMALTHLRKAEQESR